MCGRFVLAISGEAIAASMEAAPLLPAFVEALAAWQERFNIAPSTQIPVVTSAGATGPTGGDREPAATRAISFMRWGLVPFWAKEASIGARMTNARSDSLAEKPAFRDAWRRRRCLVPATAFYEWHQPEEGGAKQPYAIASAHGEVLALAGIWERWRDPAAEGVELLTVAIITTDANELMRPIHHRMPVIIEPAHRDRWLGAAAPPEDLLRPSDPGLLRAWRVSTLVNSVRNDRPECVASVGDGEEPGKITRNA